MDTFEVINSRDENFIYIRARAGEKNYRIAHSLKDVGHPRSEVRYKHEYFKVKRRVEMPDEKTCFAETEESLGYKSHVVMAWEGAVKLFNYHSYPDQLHVLIREKDGYVCIYYLKAPDNLTHCRFPTPFGGISMFADGHGAWENEDIGWLKFLTGTKQDEPKSFGTRIELSTNQRFGWDLDDQGVIRTEVIQQEQKPIYVGRIDGSTVVKTYHYNTPVLHHFLGMYQRNIKHYGDKEVVPTAMYETGEFLYHWLSEILTTKIEFVSARKGWSTFDMNLIARSMNFMVENTSNDARHGLLY